MDRKLPAFALALALAACAQGADPTGPEVAAPVVDRVMVPEGFLEENGGTRSDAAGDGGIGGAGGAAEVGSATAPSFNTGYAGSGG